MPSFSQDTPKPGLCAGVHYGVTPRGKPCRPRAVQVRMLMEIGREQRGDVTSIDKAASSRSLDEKRVAFEAVAIGFPGFENRVAVYQTRQEFSGTIGWPL